MTAFASPVKPESFILFASDWVPNNPILPVLLYRGVMTDKTGETAAAEIRGFIPAQRLAAPMAQRRLSLSIITIPLRMKCWRLSPVPRV